MNCPASLQNGWQPRAGPTSCYNLSGRGGYGFSVTRATNLGRDECRRILIKVFCHTNLAAARHGFRGDSPFAT